MRLPGIITLIIILISATTLLSFNHEDLTKAKKGDKNLVKADLSRADMKGMDLGGADLSEANLERANLKKARFRHANLKNANLRRANLVRADFTKANLTGADLIGADLTDALFKYSNVSGARIDRKWEADFTAVKVKGLNRVRWK